MKTLEEIINTFVPVIIEDFAGYTDEEVMRAFWADHTDEKILFATYTYENYDGNAYVIFAKDGKLFEVSGGHCSCYGLEDQWEPTEVCLAELVNRVTNGKGYDLDTYGLALKSILGLE